MSAAFDQVVTGVSGGHEVGESCDDGRWYDRVGVSQLADGVVDSDECRDLGDEIVWCHRVHLHMVAAA